MITETKKILKEIIDLNNKDKDSSGVPFTHIASHLKIDDAKILSTINELENGGFVRVKTTEDEQLQVVHTQKGFEKIYPWRTTKRWLFLFAVLGAIATFFGIMNYLFNFLPDLYNKFRSPGEHLVIEHYLVSYDRYFGTTQILRKDIDPLSEVVKSL